MQLFKNALRHQHQPRTHVKNTASYQTHPTHKSSNETDADDLEMWSITSNIQSSIQQRSGHRLSKLTRLFFEDNVSPNPYHLYQYY